MNLNLPAEMQTFLQQLVRSGRYQTENEAVVEALQRFQAREEFIASLQEGYRQIKEGKWHDGDEVLDELEAEIDAMITKPHKVQLHGE